MEFIPRRAVVEQPLLLCDEAVVAEKEHEPFSEAGVERRAAVVAGGAADDTGRRLVGCIVRHRNERLVAAQALHPELAHGELLSSRGLVVLEPHHLFGFVGNDEEGQSVESPVEGRLSDRVTAEPHLDKSDDDHRH